MRYGWVLSAFAAAVFPWGATARAAEPDPWAAEPGDDRQRMADLSEAEVAGEIGAEELDELNTYWATHLRRRPMNAVESAYYSIAEIQLKAGKGEETVAALDKALAASHDAEVRNLTHLNLAEVYRRRLKDSEKALAQYRQVTGDLRFQARYYLFTMLAEAGKAEQAAKLVDEMAASTKEKGEQLALLHRLASLYKQAKLKDQALTVYQRITKQFTPADVQEMCEAAAREAQGLLDQIATARRKEDGEEAAGRIEDQLHQRARQLRLANRWDELKAFNDAVTKGMEKLKEGEEHKE